ncbi:FMN-binding protein [Carnobacterium sp. TMP28]|uniref:FMN-binding protein n=1 Tax=Carnobacterium sp. TMP28 TaxID=3397060 RepID=UPI0039DF9FEA
MEIKKGFKLVSVIFASTIILAACGNDDAAKDESSEVASSEVMSSEVAVGELQDGTYKLEEKNLDENGWKVDFSLTVKDGEITESNYDSLNKEGKLKTEDEGYQAAMVEKVGTGPADYTPQLNDDLVAKGDPTEVEVVTGATHSSESFKTYAQQLVDAAEEGNTETIVVDNKVEEK